MSENENGQEKTEPATEKKLKESRKKGQVQRSRELNTLSLLMIGAATFIAIGDGIMRDTLAFLRWSLQPARSDIFSSEALIDRMCDVVIKGFLVWSPFLVVTVVVAMVAPVALGGWSFSVEALGFKVDRINPLKGLKRIFSAKGLLELFKALAKFLLVAIVAVMLLSSLAERILGLAGLNLYEALSNVGEIYIWSFLILSCGLILVVAVDVPFQIWDYQRQQKMTKQEVKDEMKETDGKPEVKQFIRRQQQRLAQSRMMHEVPKADVVIVNPEHYAVAIVYDQKKTSAPRVIAKGTDFIASQIRDTAKAHSVTLVSAPPLARAVYFSTELNQEIPDGLFLAVAQVLAYVYQLRKTQKVNVQPIRRFDNLTIPEELKK